MKLDNFLFLFLGLLTFNPLFFVVEFGEVNLDHVSKCLSVHIWNISTLKLFAIMLNSYTQYVNSIMLWHLRSLPTIFFSINIKLTWSFLSKYFPFAFFQNFFEVLLKLTIPKEKLNREKKITKFQFIGGFIVFLQSKPYHSEACIMYSRKKKN